jgi:hypothetical protein
VPLVRYARRYENFVLALVATVSAGDRRPLVLAVGISLRSTTHDHRRQRGDRGYPCGDIKGGSPWLVSGDSQLCVVTS